MPLPQNYTGANAWQFPLSPVPAKTPLSIKGRFLRGAIAIAANGIPIFNPQNNRGEVSAEIGELDEWGGHCGRADDYHYHAAPLHLQTVLGAKLPVAYALDGYPIYGLTEPDGSAPEGLDSFNGHTIAALGYHYHASKKYPYVNGGFHGEVVEADGQVDPQPRATPVRQDQPPLRGAKITGFESTGANSYKLAYDLNGEKRAILYAINADGTYPFEFQNGSEGTTNEVYSQRQRRGGESGGKGTRPEGGRPGGDKGGGGKPDDKGLIKPGIADTMKLNVYADNWFVLYVNGRLVAVDPIQFTPHNVVSVDFLPEYPMTIAVMAKDNADPKTGLEYGTNIGDGGFILKFGDGTVTNATWKAKNFFKGPLNRDTANPKVEHTPIPDKWWAVDFDDSKWANATEYTEERIDPKQPYFEADFKGAKFIWTEDLDLDNTIIFRTKIEKPDWKQRWNTKPDLDVTGAPFN